MDFLYDWNIRNNLERGLMESQKNPPKMHFLKRLLPMSIQLWHFQNACFQQIWCVAQQREGGRQLDIHIQILEVCFLFFLCMFAAVKLVQNMNLWLPNSPARPAASPFKFSYSALCLPTTVQPTSVLTKASVWYEIRVLWANINNIKSHAIALAFILQIDMNQIFHMRYCTLL